VIERARTVVWSPEAREDIDQIWSYYERVTGRNTAAKITDKIREVIATIEAHPFAGRSRDNLRPGFRSLAANPHVVFYRVADGIPEIIRILDGRRDIDEIFSNGSEA
jgi:toxin ParE1/3/4